MYVEEGDEVNHKTDAALSFIYKSGRQPTEHTAKNEPSKRISYVIIATCT